MNKQILAGYEFAKQAVAIEKPLAAALLSGGVLGGAAAGIPLWNWGAGQKEEKESYEKLLRAIWAKENQQKIKSTLDDYVSRGLEQYSKKIEPNLNKIIESLGDYIE